MDEFCKELPKIELHAHLNGSLSKETLKELGCDESNVEEYNKLSKILEKDTRTLDECFELFDVAYRATSTPQKVYKACQDVIKDFETDNVVYLELRTTPRSNENMTKAQYIDEIVKAVKNNRTSVIVKLIFSINRKHETSDSMDSLRLIIDYFNRYPDLIKGIELSGNPNVGFFDLNLFETARNAGLKISLHCGEIKNDSEVFEMLKFKPERLGHCTCLHPLFGGSNDIWNFYLNNPIPAEICLTSNVLCGTSKSYKEHHLQEWIKNKLPCSLGTDDKGIFNSTLTEEYYLASIHFNLSKNDIWDINYNAIEHTFASEDEKAHLRQLLKAWKTDM